MELDPWLSSKCLVLEVASSSYLPFRQGQGGQSIVCRFVIILPGEKEQGAPTPIWPPAPYCAMAQVDDALVRRATSFMFNLMKTDLDVFFEAHCHHFEGGEEEHKLVYTKLYKEFEKIVDYKMNDFVRDEGYSSSRALYKDILESVENSPRSTLYLNVFLAAADYEKFVKLMKRRSSKRREEAKLDEDNDAYEGDASGGDDSECSSGSGGNYWSSRYGGKQADPGIQKDGRSMAEGGSWKK